MRGPYTGLRLFFGLDIISVSILNSEPHDAPAGPRPALRRHLLEQRAQFVADSGAAIAASALGAHLVEVLLALGPQRLGVYTPYRREFNAVAALAVDSTLAKLPLALPFTQRAPVRMHYRTWDAQTRPVLDECRIVSSDGAEVVPDVALVPCVGYTRTGFRLGYGAGYFDRWLAEHPDVTTVGIAWAFSEIDSQLLDPQPHDRPLTLILTEQGAA